MTKYPIHKEARNSNNYDLNRQGGPQRTCVRAFLQFIVSQIRPCDLSAPCSAIHVSSFGIHSELGISSFVIHPQDFASEDGAAMGVGGEGRQKDCRIARVSIFLTLNPF